MKGHWNKISTYLKVAKYARMYENSGKISNWESSAMFSLWLWRETEQISHCFDPKMILLSFSYHFGIPKYYLIVCLFSFGLAHLALQTENIIQNITQPKWWKTKNEVTKICDEPGIWKFFIFGQKFLRIK